MRWSRFRRFLVWSVLLPGSAVAEHSALLPRPQQIRYEDRRVSVRSLSIRLPNDVTAEDRFAADTLSNCLTRRALSPVRVSQGRASISVISLKRTGPVDALPMPGEQPGPSSREAYFIKVTVDGGEIQAASSAGLFYGAATLCQLIEGNAADAMLPEVEIRDWPSFAYRGTMIDISHGALPSEEEMKRQLDFLALWKTNQLYLYSEASIELDGYPLLRPEGRMSKDEVRRIIEYGRERHIDIIPNIELYGHLHDLFRVEEYSELSDMPHGIEFDPRNPEVMPLLADWVNQYSTLFPSPFVHIGFDETFQIAMASQKKGDSATPISLFVKQLNDVARLFEERGKHVLAFADIMLEYPQIISALPSGLIAVPWHYKTEPNDREYKEFLGPLVAKGIPHFVEPGVTSWGTITPDFATTFENIDTFITAGRKSKAQGVITAVWMDKGQMLLRMSMPGMAYGAAAAWQSRPMDRAKFFSDYTRLIYPAGIAIDVAAALEALSESEAMLQATLGDYTLFALWEDPFFPAYLKLQPKDRANLRHVRLLAEDAQKHLQRALDSGTDPTLLSSFLLGSRLLDYAGQKFQTPPEVLEVWKRLGPRRPEAERFWNEWESIFEDHSRFVSLMDAITELRSLYREEWLAQYRPYRLGTALGRWDAEYEYWLRFQQRMKEFSDSTHEGDPLPPLETFSGRH